MGSGAGTVLIVIVVVALAAFFIIPQLDIPSLDQITASIRQLFGGGGSADGLAAISFIIHYADGTSEEVTASQLSVVQYNNKDTSSITLLVKGKLSSNQSITAWNSNSTVFVELYKGSDSVAKYSSSGSYVQVGSSWGNNAVKTLATIPISESTLNGLMSAYGSGMWLLQVTSSIKLSATIGGALTDFTAQTPSGGLNIKLEA
jgi:hypothetical protein